MNQRGEMTVTSCLLLFTLSSLVILGALELQSAFSLLKKRTHLFLCVKEIKGEHHRYLQFMGRTNWGIRNANRAALIMIFIPGAQAGAATAEKVKKFLKGTQDFMLISYLKTLALHQKKGCPVDPRMYMTPFVLGGTGYKRDAEEAALLRKNEWTYLYFSRPYLLNVTVMAKGLESVNPKPNYKTSEKGAKLSFLSSSSWLQ
jgi:hypothetical protein